MGVLHTDNEGWHTGLLHTGRITNGTQAYFAQEAQTNGTQAFFTQEE
jgi:hypothetical protein